MIHEVPSEFKDEEKWLKFFPKRTFAILGITFAITIGLYNLFNLFGCGIAGVAIGSLLMIVCVGSSMIPIATTEYLRGGGLPLDKYLLRRIRHNSKKNRVIYIKHYNSDIEMIQKAEEKREIEMNELEEDA